MQTVSYPGTIHTPDAPASELRPTHGRLISGLAFVVYVDGTWHESRPYIIAGEGTTLPAFGQRE